MYSAKGMADLRKSIHLREGDSVREFNKSPTYLQEVAVRVAVGYPKAQLLLKIPLHLQLVHHQSKCSNFDTCQV